MAYKVASIMLKGIRIISLVIVINYLATTTHLKVNQIAYQDKEIQLSATLRLSMVMASKIGDLLSIYL